VGPAGHSVGLRGGVGSIFSGAVHPSNSIGSASKVAMYGGLPARSVRVAYVDWRGKHMCRIYQVSPIGCTSIRFVTTLGYE
jgi:hypothetical protein